MKRFALGLSGALCLAMVIAAGGCSKQGDKSTTLQTSNSFQKRQLPKPPEAKKAPE
jgi:hypothetical protein